MESDAHKAGLYRWQRQSKPKVQSRSHRVTSSSDIQDWIKKVEQASTEATDAAFGLKPASTGKQRGKMAAQTRSEQVRYHESAYSEAQQLLSQWVTDKVRFDDDGDDGYDDLEAWRRARANRQTVTAGKGHSDGDNEDFSLERLTRLALEDDCEIDEAAIYERVKRSAIGDTDPYEDLYDMDLPDAVDSVLKNMLSKEVVKDTFKKKIGLDEEAPPDPRTKMELRHQMVKENREKRQRVEDRRRQEAAMKKEARLAAQKLILKEQKERESRAKQEDQQLKKDMARIRKEMHDERMKKEDDLKRKREEKEALERLARAELERQTVAEQRDEIEYQRMESDRRKKQLIQREMLSARITSLNLQCLHRHFSAWYDLVLSRRLLLGKVKAMSDWKLMLRVWGAWRSHVRGRRLEVETELHERNIIEAERHKVQAERHFSYTILRRCLYAWHRFAAESVQRKEMEEEQQRTKSKMAALLSAVAEGKLEGGNSSDKGENSGGKSGRSTARSSTQSARSRQPVAQTLRQAGEKKPSDANPAPSSVSDVSNNHTGTPHRHGAYTSGCGMPVPTEAWQVTRKHVNLTKEQIAMLGDSDFDGVEGEGRSHTDVEIRRRQGTQPWMNRQFVPNSFEHRYTAQQTALKEQQAQIREQRRLIEELQYEQRQQALKQRLSPGSNTPPSSIPPSSTENTQGPPAGRQIPRDEEDDNSSIVSSMTPSSVNIKGSQHNQPPQGFYQEQDMRTPVSTTLQYNGVERGNNSERTIGSVTERSDLTSAPSSVSTQNTKYLRVLKNMEDRAAERARLKAEREERKRIIEEEKAAQLAREEEEKQKQIEAEKKAKIEAYRQKKRLEKQKEEEKQREQARQQEMNKLAEEHYTRSVLKYRGLLPFKKLISLSKRNWLKSVRHHDRSLLRQCLHSWKQFTDEETRRKNVVADKMREFILTKRCFLNWRHYKYHQHFLERRAQKHYNETLRCKVFHAWSESIIAEREETSRLMEEANNTYLRNLVKKSFLGWRDLPLKLKREEEKQKRKLELRKRVAQLIPDFAPTGQTSIETDTSEGFS